MCSIFAFPTVNGLRAAPRYVCRVYLCVIEGSAGWYKCLDGAYDECISARAREMRDRASAHACAAWAWACVHTYLLPQLTPVSQQPMEPDPRLFGRAVGDQYDAIDVALEYCDYAKRVATTSSTSMRQVVSRGVAERKAVGHPYTDIKTVTESREGDTYIQTETERKQRG